jgi:hypothetical protein
MYQENPAEVLAGKDHHYPVENLDPFMNTAD